MKKKAIMCTGGEAMALAVLDGEPLCADCLYKAVQQGISDKLMEKIAPLVAADPEARSAQNGDD